MKNPVATLTTAICDEGAPSVLASRYSVAFLSPQHSQDPLGPSRQSIVTTHTRYSLRNTSKPLKGPSPRPFPAALRSQFSTMLPYIVAPLLLALSSAVSVSAITVSSPAINQVGILLRFFGDLLVACERPTTSPEAPRSDLMYPIMGPKPRICTFYLTSSVVPGRHIPNR